MRKDKLFVMKKECCKGNSYERTMEKVLNTVDTSGKRINHTKKMWAKKETKRIKKYEWG